MDNGTALPYRVQHHRKPMVFDIHCIAICRYYGARWHRGMDNKLALLDEVRGVTFSQEPE